MTSGVRNSRYGPLASFDPTAALLASGGEPGVAHDSPRYGLGPTESSAVPTDAAPPAITLGAATASFTAGGPPVDLEPHLTIADAGSDTMTIATVTIHNGLIAGDMLSALDAAGLAQSYVASTGVLTLSGSASLATYQAALDSVTYSFGGAGGDASDGGLDDGRSIDWTLTDSLGATSTLVTSALDVAPPTLALGDRSATFTAGGPAVDLAPELTVGETVTPTLNSATVAIGGGLLPGDTLAAADANGLTQSYDASTGVLTLSGAASLATYEAALDSVTYSFVSGDDDPTNGGVDNSRTLDWTVTDAKGGISLPATTTIAVLHVGPAVTAVPTASYTGGGAAAVIGAGLTITDPDSGGDLSSARVTITSGAVAGDTLAVTTPQNGLAVSYDAATFSLDISGQGTLSAYEAVLDSVAYSFSGGDPTVAGADPTRTVTWIVHDSSAVGGEGATISTIDVHPALVTDTLTITGSVPGQETGVQTPIDPFAKVTISETTSGAATDTLSIQLSGPGALADGAGFHGLTATATAGLYTLSGSASAVSQEIDALVFTPAASPTHVATTIGFTLTAKSTAGASASDSTTTVMVDPGPTTGAASATVALGKSVDLTSLILGAATPGIVGDKLTITADGTTGTLGAVTLTNGELVYSATTAALSKISANGSEADSFVYTITDPFGDVATGTVELTVTNPGNVIKGPSNGHAKIEGTSGADIIYAYGTHDTIYDNGGNDVVYAGTGVAKVFTASGNVTVDLQGYDDVVSGGNGADSVSGSAGNASVALGSGADSVSAGGYDNKICLGSGADIVDAGQGDSRISLGGGNDKVTIGGYSDEVTAGNGADSVTGGLGEETIRLGNGADSVDVGGYSNFIRVGSGSDKIVAGAGSDTVVAGAGVDAITLAGEGDSVKLNGTTATVSGGEGGETVVVNGGKDFLYFAGSGDEVALSGTVTAGIGDLGQKLRLLIGSSTQMDTITGFGGDPDGLVDLQHGAGGYGSVTAILHALHSDGRGGTMLSLGSSGWIDFAGTTTSELHASNFKIG